jgi:predicted transposase/invertase (TIGR01784 family)
MIDHDRLFKELIAAFFMEFIELFLPEVRDYIDAGSFELLDKEVFTDVTFGERHEVDLVAKVRFKEQDTFFLVHVENQAQPQSNFARRMFAYFARLHEKHDLPVYPIALLTYDAPVSVQSDSYDVTFPDRAVLRFQFRAIQLNRFKWQDFVRQKNPAASALMAKMKIAPEDRARVKLECVRLLSTLKLDKARMQLIIGFVDTYLRLDQEEQARYGVELQKLGPVEREKVMEVTMSWREAALQEGLEQGVRQGFRQGKQEGMLSVIAHQIERRFGQLDPATRERIEQLNPDQLEGLGDALLDFAKAEDLANWLESA